VYGTAEDEQGVVSAMTRQRRGFGGWRGAGELCWWMQVGGRDLQSSPKLLQFHPIQMDPL